MKGYESDRARCPFYVSEGPMVIRCEAPVKGAKLELFFTKKKDKEEARQKCCGKYEECPLARAGFAYWRGK